MNSGRLWNSHQRHKFLRAEISRDILKFRATEMVFPGVFERHLVTSEYTKTGNSAFEMSQAFHDIARFERFTGLLLTQFKYAFNVIQNWETVALHFIRWYLFFAISKLRMANSPAVLAGYGPLMTALTL